MTWAALASGWAVCPQVVQAKWSRSGRLAGSVAPQAAQVCEVWAAGTRTSVAQCLAYDRCITTDEPAIDRVSLRWPTGRRPHRLVPFAAADLVRPVSRALLTTPAPQGEVSAVLLWSGAEAPQKLHAPIGRTVSRAFRMLGLAWLWVIAAVAALLTTGSVISTAVPAGIYLASRRYLLSRYCIPAQVQGRFLKLGNVSDGFRARVESVIAAEGGHDTDRAAGSSGPTG